MIIWWWLIDVEIDRRYYILLRIFKTYCFSGLPGCVSDIPWAVLVRAQICSTKAHLVTEPTLRLQITAATIGFSARSPDTHVDDLLTCWIKSCIENHWKTLSVFTWFLQTCQVCGSSMIPFRWRNRWDTDPQGCFRHSVRQQNVRKSWHTHSMTTWLSCAICIYLHFQVLPHFLCVFGWLMPGFA